MKSTIVHTRTKNQMDKVCVYVIIHYVLEKERPCFLIPFCLISDVRQRGEDTCSGFAQIRWGWGRGATKCEEEEQSRNFKQM